MRLLYIVQYFRFPDETGGTRPYDLASSFAKHGIDVTVLTSDQIGNKKNIWTFIERDGIKVYRVNCPYSHDMGTFQRIVAFCKFFVQASIKQFRFDYDVMLSSSTPLTNGIPALVAKVFRNKPYIFEVRDVWPGVPIAMGYFKNKLLRKFLYAFEKRIYKKASAIIPLSIGMDSNIKNRYPNNKSVIIPNISEINRFSDTKKTVDIDFPIDKKVVLYAGTFGNVNGLTYVINLAEKTLNIDSNVCFYLIGKGKEKNDIVKIAEIKGVLNKNVFIFDPVRKNDLPYLYSKCTMGASFVIDIPALWDNSANKFFDTLAAQKPMLINHEGWQADLIRQNNIGYVLPPVIDEFVAKQFVEYINDVELLKIQGKNAYMIAKNEFSLEVAVDRYLKIFESIKF